MNGNRKKEDVVKFTLYSIQVAFIGNHTCYEIAWKDSALCFSLITQCQPKSESEIPEREKLSCVQITKLLCIALLQALFEYNLFFCCFFEFVSPSCLMLAVLLLML